MGSRFPNPKLDQALRRRHRCPQTADNLAARIRYHARGQRPLRARLPAALRGRQGRRLLHGEIDGRRAAAARQGAAVPSVAEDEHPRPETDMASAGQAARPVRGRRDDRRQRVRRQRRRRGDARRQPRGGRKGRRRSRSRRILAGAVAGVEPRIMGFGPVPACQEGAGACRTELKDMDVIEINEAFATQVLACLRRLSESTSTTAGVNPNGGAIAIGHPLGASGAAHRPDRGAPAAAHRRTLRAGQPVHRRRPGHRRHHRAGLNAIIEQV